MNLLQAIDYLEGNSEYSKNIVYWKRFEPSSGDFRQFPELIDGQLVKVLNKSGIAGLYSHQAESFELAQKKADFVVVTPTASGKSLCYNLPVLNTLLKDDPEARALYLFPTKALSADQVDELYNMVEALGVDIKTYTFDGDTPASARSAIRKAGHIVVTNPDMLHTGILPHHTLWIKLFDKLRFIVIDELHHYRGVFGSHLANVLRRLQRLCDFYGSQPQYICCSATIGNPGELAEKITGRKLQVIDKNGAPTGGKHFVLYNPPIINQQLGIRKSVIKETAKLASLFIGNDIQTISFARSRVRVEVLTQYIKDKILKLRKSPDTIRGYRGGYLPNERRAIERGLRNGSITGVVSTNALELGIDIGGLDVAIMAGYPGAVASTWQQAGRAGRKIDVSLAILVASSAPLDQFLMNHPEYFFGKSPESGIVDPDNLILMVSHLKCAAFELPVEQDEKFGSAPVSKIMDYLQDERLVHLSQNRYHYTSEVYPATDVSLRSASPENFVVMDESDHGRVIGEIDQFSAPELLHPEAIYLHQTAQYQIRQLDWQGKRAYAIPVEVEYFTDAESKVSIKVLNKDKENKNKTIRGLGDVSVTRVVVNYKKIRFNTHENVGWGRVNLPEQTMHTTSFWVSFPEALLQTLGLSKNQLGGGLRGCAHLLRQIVSLWIMSDPADIRSVAMVKSPYQELPTIYIYDNYPGGVGFSRKIYFMFDEIIKAALEYLGRCPCESGCPSCVGPMLEVGERGKYAAELLFKTIL
jgi:DEAD/DEAH box helicase domain-containing protein